MQDKNRQSIQIKVSKVEILLLAINLLFFAFPITYFISNWERIPHTILGIRGGKSAGDQPKLIYFVSSSLFHFQCLVFAICVVRFDRGINEDFLKRKEISRVFSKAKKQFLIEKYCYLCGLAELQFYYLSYIAEIEYQIKNHAMMPIDAKNIFWLSFPIVILFNWLIHHTFWSRLTDKRSMNL
jgi:hypothetical protein